jgi:hypothetical protein
MRDIHNNLKPSRGISPAAIIAANGTTTGQTIDVSEFGSLEFLFQSGAITDGTFTVTVYEGDAANMSDEAAVADADLLGAEPVFADTDDNTVKRVGYIGSKRYVRAKVVQAGATTGGFIACIAVQGHPRTAPVA